MTKENKIKLSLKIIFLIFYVAFIALYSTYIFKNSGSTLFYNICILILLIALLILFIIRFKIKDSNKPIFEFLENKKYEIIAVSTVVIIALILRAIMLTSLPAGLMSDEASMLYEAWCIGNYGTDRYGNSMPVYLVSWGSGQNALLTYLTVPFVLMFGMNAFTARIVMYIVINTSMITFYFLIRKIFNKRLAFICLLLFAFLPYTFMMSRFGLESYLLPAFLIFGLLFLVKSIKDNHWWFVLASFFFGLSLYAYAVNFIFLPLLLVGCYITMIVKKKVNWKSFIIGNIILFAFALPLILFVCVNYFGVEPFNFLGVFAIPKLSALRDGANGLHILTNIKNLFKLFTYQYDGLFWNTAPPFGFVLPMSLPFAVIGIIKFYSDFRLKENRSTINIILAVFSVAGLISALLLTTASLNHVGYMLPVYFMFIGIGIDYFIANKGLCAIILACIFGVSCILFYTYYYSPANQQRSIFEQDIYKAVECAESMRGENTIIVTDTQYVSIFIVNPVSPYEFSSTIVWKDPNGGIRSPLTFSHYYFDLNYEGDDCIYLLRNTTPFNEDNSYKEIVFRDYTVYYK